LRIRITEMDDKARKLVVIEKNEEPEGSESGV
jgi:hypothetical protein